MLSPITVQLPRLTTSLQMKPRVLSSSNLLSFEAHYHTGTNVQGARSIEELVAKLKRPRKIIMLVKAGAAVDDFIRQLTPHLDTGDIARHGPSLMPGGSPAAWPAIKEIFQKTSAQVQGDPCADWMGESGAGHYVKMVHNGMHSFHHIRSCVRNFLSRYRIW